MLYKISKAGAGATIFIIAFLNVFGYQVPEELVENAVAGGIAVIGLLVWIWGQIDREDLKWGIFRK